MALRLPLPVRRLASLPIRSVPLRIRTGPNAGRRWSLAAGGRGIWQGRYEHDRFAALAELVGEGDVFWDIGAHRGYATLLAERLVGPTGSVRAFEPSQDNLWYLRAHLRWNRADRVDVHAAAVADFEGTADFGGEGSSVSHRLGGGSDTVPVRTVSGLVEEEGLEPPTFLKIDVEGAESRVLEGARRTLESCANDTARTLPALLVSVHSGPQFTACLDVLRALPYRILGSAGLNAFMDRLDASWHDDPDVLALPVGSRIDPDAVRRTRWFHGGPELTDRTSPTAPPPTDRP